MPRRERTIIEKLDSFVQKHLLEMESTNPDHNWYASLRQKALNDGGQGHSYTMSELVRINEDLQRIDALKTERRAQKICGLFSRHRPSEEKLLSDEINRTFIIPQQLREYIYLEASQIRQNDHSSRSTFYKKLSSSLLNAYTFSSNDLMELKTDIDTKQTELSRRGMKIPGHLFEANTILSRTFSDIVLPSEEEGISRQSHQP